MSALEIKDGVSFLSERQDSNRFALNVGVRCGISGGFCGRAPGGRLVKGRKHYRRSVAQQCLFTDSLLCVCVPSTNVILLGNKKTRKKLEWMSLRKEKRMEDKKLDMTLEKENYIKERREASPGGSKCGNKVRYR